MNPSQTVVSRSYPIVRTLARLGFTLTVILIPFRLRTVLQARPFPPIYRDYTDFLMFAADTFMLLTILFWAASLVLKPHRIHLGPWFISLPLVGVTALGLVSVLASRDPALSLYHAFRLILLALFYVYVLNEVRSPLAIVLPVAIQVSIQSFVGIAQALAQASLGLQRIGEYPLNPEWQGVSIISVEGSRWLRAYGLSDHPNILGGCLAFGLLIILAAVARTYTLGSLLLFGVFILGAEALFLTFSRSAWLAFFAGAGLLLVYLWMKKSLGTLHRTAMQLFVAGMLVLPFVMFLTPALTNRLNLTQQARQNPQEQQSIGERQLLNQATNQIFVQNALFGVGLGALPTAMLDSYPQFRVDYQPAHLVLLDVAAETGLFGATLYALLLILPWMALWINRRRLRFMPDLAVACSLLLAATVIGMLDYYTWLLVPGRLWQWLIWGLWAGAYLTAQNGASND